MAANDSKAGDEPALKLEIQIDPANIRFVSGDVRRSFKLLVAAFAIDLETGKRNELYCEAGQEFLRKDEYRKLTQTIVRGTTVAPLPPAGQSLEIVVYDFAQKRGCGACPPNSRDFSAELCDTMCGGLHMATNLSIDPELIDRALAVSGEKTKKAAVTKALQEFIARREQKRILELFATLEWDPDFDYKRERSR